MIGAQRVRIDQNLVGTVPAFTFVSDGKVLVRPALGEKIGLLPHAGEPKTIHLHQLRKALGNLGATRERVQSCSGTTILVVNPRACLAAFLVLEPPIGISYGYAVDLLDNISLPRDRRTS